MSLFRRAFGLFLLCCFVCLGLAEAGVAQGESKAIRAKLLYTGTGPAIQDGVILFRDGRILAVGPGLSVPSSVPVTEVKVVAPGWVDLMTRLGAFEDAFESSHLILSEARAADGVDPHHLDFRKAVRSGTTTVLIAAANRALVPGRGAIVKTGSPGMNGARIVRRDGPLKVYVGSGALSNQMGPTAPAGLIHELRTSLSGNAGGDSGSDLRGLLSGEERALLDWSHPGDLLGTLPVVKDAGLNLIVQGQDGIERLLPDLKSAGFPVVFAPASASSLGRYLEAPARFQEAGLTIAFGSDSPRWSPEALRVAAAMAVQNGLDADVAFRAITSVPAELLGVADRVGSLSPGKDADFAIWTGDPLDLSSRLIATYVDGHRVFRAGGHKGEKRPGARGHHD